MIRLFHASDLHFGAEDPAALDWFAGLVEIERPDAVVITGDITMRARAREFAAAAEWLSALPAPVTVEIGNHDMPYFNPIERITRPYARYGRMEALVERAIDLPGLAIVPLRTTSRAQMRLNWSKGIVRPKNLARAVAAIDAHPPETVRIIAAHHPLVESGTRGTALTRGGNRALRELTRVGATAVLSGHVHDPFDLTHETPHGSIRMIGAGTLSERVRTTRPSFNALAIEGSEIAVRVRAMA
jgi:3',5'-cyclic AMP phosphodiesterase CpdA